MEDFGKQNIKENLQDLVEMIYCDSLFLAALKSKDVLSKYDTVELEGKGNRYDKAKYLLDILETRQKGYQALLWALFKTNQTGALDILLRQSSSKLLEFLLIDLQGSVFPMKTLYPCELGKLWTKLTKNITKDELAKLFSTVENPQNPVRLLSETIPKALPYYVPRTLSKRLRINQNIFRHECPDVFVIKGMQRHKLTELADCQSTASSKSQKEKITVRFINLEDRDDWEDIRSFSEAPIHLISYEAELNTFVLEETCGASSILQHFLEKRGSEECTIPEDKFFHDTGATNTKSVCICDLPGMGKTLLLANLARRAQQDLNITVAFVVLQHFVTYAQGSSWGGSDEEIVHPLFEHISPSRLGANILFKLVQDEKIEMKIFFDGFDEIGEDDVMWTQRLLQSLTNYPNIKIYVTSRPHTRHELENTLGVLAYDILPFDEDNQIYFLSNFWAEKYREVSSVKASLSSDTFLELKKFGKLCLTHFKDSVSSDERDIAGIPIQCRLIAEVYTRGALRYSNPSSTSSVNEVINFGKSMFDMYKNYVDMKFSEKIALSQDKKGKIGEMVLKQNYKNQHYLIALQAIFPRFSLNFRNINLSLLGQSCKPKELMSCGLLEKVYNGREIVCQFIHRTIAEYLVADFFSNQLANLNSKPINGSILSTIKSFFIAVVRTLNLNDEGNVDTLSTILFEHLFRRREAQHRLQNMIDRSRPRAHFFTFSNATILYFLDYHLGTFFDKTERYTEISLLKFPLRQGLLEILESCGYHNYTNIFTFIKATYSNTAMFNQILLRILTPNKKICELMSVYCEYSNPVLVEKVTEFLDEFLCIKIDQIVKTCNTNNWVSPLQFACMRKSYDLSELLVKKLKCSTDRQCLLHFCSEHSTGDSPTGTNERIQMMQFLLEKNADLIRERDYCNNTAILASGASLSIITFLVENGAKINATDSMCATIAHIASGWMSNAEFHDFILFLVRKFPRLLKARDMRDRSPLFEALRKVRDLKGDTVCLIINQTQMNINEKNINAENIVFAAVWGGQKVSLLEMLIDMGADINILNRKNENLIHFAAKRWNVEALKILLSLGLDPNIRNNEGKTPIQLANETTEPLVNDGGTKAEIINILSQVSI